jgi:hypothetical protein
LDYACNSRKNILLSDQRLVASPETEIKNNSPHPAFGTFVEPYVTRRPLHTSPRSRGERSAEGRVRGFLALFSVFLDRAYRRVMIHLGEESDE